MIWVILILLAVGLVTVTAVRGGARLSDLGGGPCLDCRDGNHAACDGCPCCDPKVP